MSAVISNVLYDLESEMQAISEFEFARLAASDFLWWRKVAKLRPTSKKREIVTWLLSTAQIRQQPASPTAAPGANVLTNASYDVGEVQYDDLAATYKEFDVLPATAGLRMSRSQILDNDGNGYDFAGQWAADIGAKMAYWPQALVANLVINGSLSTNTTYDGVQFFADNVVNSGNGHPTNQFQLNLGGYCNWLHGASAGATSSLASYPGALPIDESVSIDVAYLNLQKAISYVKSLKMPDGVTPRALNVRGIICAPRLQLRATTLMNAEYISMSSSGGGGGTTDMRGIKTKWGLAEPIVAQELAGVALPGGNTPTDTAWFLLCEEITTTQLGSLVYVDREPFRIQYYTGEGGQNVNLARTNELEWICRGRNTAGFGHPYSIFRIDPT